MSERDVEPLRVPAPLSRLPWDLAQDQFEVQGADFIAIFGRLLLVYTQDVMRAQLRASIEEIRRHGENSAQDPIGGQAKSKPP